MKNLLKLWLGVLIIWTLYRVLFHLPEWADEFLIKPLIFILIPLNFTHMKIIPGFEGKKNVFEDLIIGASVGFVFGFVALLSNKIKYGAFVFSPVLSFIGLGLPFYLLISLATSFSEEVLGRGFFFNYLHQKKSTFVSAVISSFMFLTLHLPLVFAKTHLTGITLIVYFISIFLLGVVNCYIYQTRKSLVIPILIHTFWNMSIALYL